MAEIGVLHLFGISGEDLNDHEFEIDPYVKKGVIDEFGYDNVADSVLAAINNGDFLLPKGTGFDHIEVVLADADSLFVGFCIQEPWDMAVKTKEEMLGEIQAFLDYFFVDVPPDYAKIFADTFFYGFE